MTPTCQLGDIASVVMGQAPPGSDCNKDGRGEPFVKAGEFSADKPIVREWTTNPLKRAQDGDVLVCVVGATAGKVNLAIDCAIGRSVAAVRPLPLRLDTNYLHHFLRTKTMALRHGSQGLAQGVITREMLLSLKIPLPPLEEQRRIAAILDKGNTLRELSQLNNQSLEALERKIFLDLFGDPVGNDKGWIKGRVGDLVSRFETGKSLGSGEGDISETLRIIRVSAVSSGRFKPGESKPAPRGYSPPASHFVNQGDLLFCRANTDALIGTVAYVEHSPCDLLLSDKVWRFCWSDSASYFPLYVKQLFSHPSVRQEIRMRATGTSGSMLNISQSSVLEIPISLPPVDIQKRFHAIASACLNIYSRNAKQNERLAALASSLSQSLLG